MNQRNISQYILKQVIVDLQITEIRETFDEMHVWIYKLLVLYYQI